MGRVKGTMLIPMVKLLRTYRAQAQALLPAALQKYLHDERVLASAWYPSEDHVAMSRALAAILPLGPQPYIAMGRTAALGDLHGIYRALLKEGDPQRTLRGANSLWKTYRDSGELTEQFEGSNKAIVELRGFLDTTREMCGIAGGYIEGVVIAAGGKDPKLEKLACKLDGAPVCRWQITWS